MDLSSDFRQPHSQNKSAGTNSISQHYAAANISSWRKPPSVTISRLVEGTSIKASFLLENTSLTGIVTLNFLNESHSLAGRHYTNLPYK